MELFSWLLIKFYKSNHMSFSTSMLLLISTPTSVTASFFYLLVSVPLPIVMSNRISRFSFISSFLSGLRLSFTFISAVSPFTWVFLSSLFVSLSSLSIRLGRRRVRGRRTAGTSTARTWAGASFLLSLLFLFFGWFLFLDDDSWFFFKFWSFFEFFIRGVYLFGLIFLFDKFCHGFFVFFFHIFGNLIDH